MGRPVTDRRHTGIQRKDRPEKVPRVSSEVIPRAQSFSLCPSKPAHFVAPSGMSTTRWE